MRLVSYNVSLVDTKQQYMIAVMLPDEFTRKKEQCLYLSDLLNALAHNLIDISVLDVSEKIECDCDE